MQLVYFSHSYREEDATIVDFFAKLITSEGLIPSLDPPSNRLNSAKPERHLKDTDGMIVILTSRESGVSQYILYEVLLCIRSNMPLLVFVEDILPDNIIPKRILQHRFSRRGILRQIRDLKFSITTFKQYIGDSPPPKYQPSMNKKSCIITGLNELPTTVQTDVVKEIEERGYTAVIIKITLWSDVYEQDFQELLINCNLVICFLESTSAVNHFITGASRSFLTPSILLTSNSGYVFNKKVPLEYQPRIIEKSKATRLRNIISNEVSIFEEEYVDLEDQKKVDTYAELLIRESSPKGEYTDQIRNLFIKELVVGDKFENINNSTIVNRSKLESALNNTSNSNNEIERAFKDISEYVDKTSDKNSIDMLNSLLSEMNKPEPEQNKVVQKTLWNGLLEAIPNVTKIAGSVAKVAALFA